MKIRHILLGVLAGAPALTSAGDLTVPTTVICTPEPLICTTFAASSNDRFNPLVQHLLVRGQLQAQPKGWQMIYLYVPAMDARALEELQIRFLDELLARQSEKEADKKTASKEPADTKP